MTIEQLEQGNKIRCELERLSHFKSRCILQRINLVSDDEKLYLREYPDITEAIQSCISDKIDELEKQLEEL